MTEQSAEDPVISGFCLQSPYSDELFALCKKLDKDIGLHNGATALYWHLQPIFELHLKKR